jgi:Icc-related predicted phosphoesterase
MRITTIIERPFHVLNYWSSGRSECPECRVLEFIRAEVEGLPAGIDALVATADLQGRDELGGKLLGEVVAEELAVLSEAGQIPPVAGALLAGDFYDHPDCHRRGGTGNVRPVWQAFAKQFPWVLGVHGNHDELDESRLPDNAVVLDADLVDRSGIRFGGLCGIMGRPTKNQRRETGEYLLLLEATLESDPGIMLMHCGPNDPETGRIGEPAVRSVLERAGKALVVFGHSYWPDPLADVEGNQVLNVDGRVAVLHRP